MVRTIVNKKALYNLRGTNLFYVEEAILHWQHCQPANKSMLGVNLVNLISYSMTPELYMI